MSYGTIKVNTITFTNNGVDQSVTVSGIVASTSGNLTVTGTVSGSTASFANGTFNTFSGGTCTITSGVLASGTASNPAISFNGDVNTGIYSPNADEIGFTTNGQARFIIDANGQLEASSAGSASSPTYTFANDVDTGLYSPGTNQLALSTGGVEKVKLSDSEVVFNDGGGNVDFRVEGDTNANLLFVDASTDRAGIRTNTPEQPLDMRGGAFASNQNFGFQIGTPNGEWKARFSIKSNSSGVSRTAIDALSDNLGGTIEAISVRSNGNVGIGTTSPNESLEVAGNIHVSGADRSIFNRSNNALTFGTNNVERARIDSSGRLLVGTSTSIDTKNYLNNIYGGPSVQQHGVTQATSVVAVYNWGNSSAAPAAISLNKSLGGTVGVRGALTTPSQDIGSIVFSGDDGTVFIPAATILVELDGTPGQTAGTFTVGQTYRILTTGTTDFTLIGAADSNPGTTFTATGAGTGTGTAINTAGDMPGRLVFSTTSDNAGSPAERLRIDSTGFISLGGDTNTGFSNPSADNLAITTGGSERARIDSSGRLLVGTSSALSNVQWFGTTYIAPVRQTAGIGHFGEGLFSYANSGSAGAYYFNKSRGTSIGSNAIVANNDLFGEVVFSGNDGTNFIRGAVITALVDGTPGANDMPGRLVFSTTADGGSSPTEALRITNDQVIAYNQAAPVSKSTAVTLTIEELKNGIIQYTGNAQTLTLPTGTSSEGGFSGLYNNMTFEWSVINTGSGTCTVAGNTGHTVVGAGAVAAGSSGRFASRRTGANTFVTYRLS